MQQDPNPRMQQDLEVLREVWPLCNTFNLRPKDVVIVAGCFTGKVMDLLLTMYPGITIFGFDPQQWAIDRASARLTKHNPMYFNLKPYGLGVEDAVLKMYDWETDACSTDTWNTHKPSKYAIFKDYTSVMTELCIPVVDLFVMNMEGFEFILLPHLIDEIKGVCFIKQLAVQWHLHDRPSSEMDDLIYQLSKTHKLQWDQRPQWTHHTLR